MRRFALGMSQAMKSTPAYINPEMKWTFRTSLSLANQKNYLGFTADNTSKPRQDGCLEQDTIKRLMGYRTKHELR